MDLIDLPNELIASIGRHLPAQDLARLETTSKAVYAALRSGDRAEATAAWHRDTYGPLIPPRLPDPGAHAGPAWRAIIREAHARDAQPGTARGLCALEASVEEGALEPAIAACQPFSHLPSVALAEAELVHRALLGQRRKAEAAALHAERIAPQLALEAALAMSESEPALAKAEAEATQVEAVTRALLQGARVDWPGWSRALQARAPRAVFERLDDALEAERDGDDARRVVCDAALARRWDVVPLAARGLDELPRALRDGLAHASSALLETLAPLLGADAARVLRERLPPMPTRRRPAQPTALPSVAALHALLTAAQDAPADRVSEDAISTGLHGLLTQGGAQAAELIEAMLAHGIRLTARRALMALQACLGDPLPTLEVLLAHAPFHKGGALQDLLVTLAARPTPDALPCLERLLQAGAQPDVAGRGPQGESTPLAAAQRAGCQANLLCLQQA